MHSIDVTSADVVFGGELGSELENRTLTFSIDYIFTPDESYYIIIDGGTLYKFLYYNKLCAMANMLILLGCNLIVILVLCFRCSSW